MGSDTPILGNIYFKFSVADNNGKHGSIWYLKVRNNKGDPLKRDIYLGTAVKGLPKISFHSADISHFAYDYEMAKKCGLPIKKNSDRKISSWKATKDLPSVGVLLRIITPIAALQSESSLNGVTIIPSAPLGLSTEITVLLQKKDIRCPYWPSKRTMQTELLKYFVLPSGETLWFVYRYIEFPQINVPKKIQVSPENVTYGDPNFVESNNLKAILWADELTLIDLKLQFISTKAKQAHKAARIRKNISKVCKQVI